MQNINKSTVPLLEFMSKCNKEINHGSQNVLGVLTWVEIGRY